MINRDFLLSGHFKDSHTHIAYTQFKLALFISSTRKCLIPNMTTGRVIQWKGRHMFPRGDAWELGCFIGLSQIRANALCFYTVCLPSLPHFVFTCVGQSPSMFRGVPLTWGCSRYMHSARRCSVLSLRVPLGNLFTVLTSLNRMLSPRLLGSSCCHYKSNMRCVTGDVKKCLCMEI